MRTSAKQHRLSTVLQDHRAPCRREVSLARLDNVEVVKAMSMSLESLIQGEIMQVPALQSIGAAVVVDGVSGVGRVTLLSYAFPFVSSGNGLLPSYQIFAAFLAVSEAETKTFRRFRR